MATLSSAPSAVAHPSSPASARDGPRVVVFGAGAVGGWIAVRLAQRGVDVAVVARGAHLAAIREAGLALRSHQDGGATVAVRVRAVDGDGCAALGPCDVLLLAVKAHQLSAAAPALASLLHDGTVVVPLVNGVPFWMGSGDAPLRAVDPDGALSRLFPAARIVGAVVYVSCNVGAPGVVHHVVDNRLLLGELDGGASPRMAALLALFDGTGIAAARVPDVRSAVFTKLLGNATVNVLAALTRAPAGPVVATLEPHVRAMMGEVSAVAAAMGVATTPVATRLDGMRGLGSMRPSTLQDVDAGRPTEVEALAGAVVELAARHGVPVPTLAFACELLRVRDRALRGEW